jgi:hypothetical protein
MKMKLIAAGIKNLKTFGYPDVNEKNILTDQIYSALFLSMLKENLGHGKAIDKEVNALIKQVEAA